MGDREGYGIAVIGMAGRFPGAEAIPQFWRNLCEGRETIRRLTLQELEDSGIPEGLLRSSRYVRARGVLDDGIELFDPEFFGYTPAEALMTGPQQRLFLEACWQALEVAGCDPARFEGRIGLYAGAPNDPYWTLVGRRASEEHASRLLEALGNSAEFLATQVSYRLGLRGPSLTLQTACSTSLVAVHLACQGLLQGECDLALAGGISITLPQVSGYLYQEGGIASPDGHCRAFDARAAGTVPANGLGVVLLKRLDEALRDGDHVQAVIRGSAINNDGSAKVGFTAPGQDGQAEVIAEAMAVGGVDPETVEYVQAHGTGTALGDPLELAALRQAFDTDKKSYCAIGSVKSNLGHLNSAAGVAGLIAAVLALEHRRIPPMVHFERPNPELGIAESPFYVNTALREWPRGAKPRRAGVSSFGIGGTNAHVVLEEAPARTQAGPSGGSDLVVVSARTEAALAQSVSRLGAYLKKHPDLSLGDVAHTLRNGRRAFAHRCALVCRDTRDAAEALTTKADRLLRGRVGDDAPRVAFLFPGEGALRPGVTAETYRHQPVFRREMDLGLDLLEPMVGQDLRKAFYAEPSAEPAPSLAPGLVMPLSVAVQYSLARLWQSWGVQPAALMGLGTGEYVAACLSGVLALGDALRLATESAGSIEARCTEAAARTVLSPPTVPLVSGVSGTWMTAEEATRPAYWARPMQNSEVSGLACRQWLADRRSVLLEVGPGGALPPSVQRFLEERPAFVSGPRNAEDGESERAGLLRASGKLWTLGVPIDWSGLDDAPRRRVPLPTYPFERQRYWLDDPAPEPTRAGAPEVGGPQAGLYSPGWRRSVPVQVPTRPATSDARGGWIVLRDPAGLADSLILGLEARGFEVFAAEKGDGYRRVAGRSFTVRPGEAGDYQALLDAVASDDVPLLGIVHAWGLDGPAPSDDAFHADDPTQSLGFFSLLSLAQALGGNSHPGGLRLEVVSKGLFDVTGDEDLVPVRATALGPCFVIPHELEGVACRVYDVVPLGDGQQERLAGLLVDEFVSEQPNGVVAYRHGHRWVPTYERVSRSDGSPHAPLGRGAYLINGGLEDPGLAFAEWLADNGADELILVASESGEADRDRVAPRLAALAAKGVRVTVEAAERTDLEAMKGVVSRAHGRAVPIRGAIHVSTAPVPGLMQYKTRETASRGLASRATAASVLERALEGERPDFLLLVGSSTGITGAAGQVDACAANAYLDAFAVARTRRGGARTLVVDWPPCRSVGGADPKADPKVGPEVAPAEGLEALQHALATNLAQVVLSRQDFGQVVHTHRQRRVATAPPRSPDRASPRRRPSTAGDYVPPHTPTESAVAAVWEQLLGFGPIGSTDDFFELGGHSLLAMEMVSRLRESLGAAIPLAEVFETPVLANLARAIAAAVPDDKERHQLDALLREVETLSPEEVSRLLAAEGASEPLPAENGREA